VTGVRHSPRRGRWQAYAVAGPTSLLAPSDVLRVDLLGGGASPPGQAPGPVAGLAVTGDRLFLARPEGGEVWVLDHSAWRSAPASVGASDARPRRRCWPAPWRWGGCPGVGVVVTASVGVTVPAGGSASITVTVSPKAMAT
jgi:hypothetical protein